MKYLESKWFDSYGLIAQRDGDGGDSAQRIGFYYTSIWLRQNEYSLEERVSLEDQFRCALDAIEVPAASGTFIRNPIRWNDPDDFSRDQQTPLVIAMGFWGMWSRLSRMLDRHVDRKMKYQNKDFATPEHVGFYIRGYGARTIYPFLFLGDLFMLLNSLIICFWKGKDPNNVGDDLNHILSLFQAKNSLPTPISWLARKVYFEFRPRNCGMFILGETHPVMGALSWYFRPETGAPPLHEMWRPIIEEEIGITEES